MSVTLVPRRFSIRARDRSNCWYFSDLNQAHSRELHQFAGERRFEKRTRLVAEVFDGDDDGRVWRDQPHEGVRLRPRNHGLRRRAGNRHNNKNDGRVEASARFVIASGSLLGLRVSGFVRLGNGRSEAVTRTHGGPFRTAGALRSRDDR